MQQAKAYADCRRFEVKYVFATNGHKYGEYDFFTQLQSGPFPLADFPAHADLTARYARDIGIDITKPEAAMLFQSDSPAWPQSRYYQDAAIRASFKKILFCRQNTEPARVLLTLATGSGKTIIATNLLWRLSQAGLLPKPVLFLCDRDELREQVYTKLKAAFGDNVRIVKSEKGVNAAQNARIHIATYQTLGLDDEEGFASFLSEHYSADAFSVIIIDECHRSAWGKWSEVLRRNPNAIHIGLTATPRKLQESKHASAEDQEITANNLKYFGEPVYEYTMIQAQEDGYLAACEIEKRKVSIDNSVFTRDEILKAGAKDIRTGDELDADYLFSFVRSRAFVEPLADLTKGALYPAVTDKQVFAQVIPWAPLDEQRRIAAHLKAQLAEVETARQAAQKLLYEINTLPQRLLARAFEQQGG